MSEAKFVSHTEIWASLVRDKWRTPDTYSKEFAPITNRSAVYLFLLVDRETYSKSMVAYVGMSTKLLQRMTGHPILQQTSNPGFFQMRWFKPVPPHALREIEAKYIKKFDPPWNIAGRTRGVKIQ